jgi:NodT family efflux transporter outer membrane factor (OMF) lipoprotein
MAGDARPVEAVLSPDARAAGPWWRSLGSPELDAVMAQALSDNQTVATAVAAVEKAQAETQSVRGGLAPQLTGNAGAERERVNLAQFGFTSLPNPTINILTIGSAVSYDLDLFGGGRRQVESSLAAQEAQAHRADAAYLTLTGNVALQAVHLAALRAEIEALATVTADDQQNLDIVRRAEAAGGEPRSASTGGRTQLAQDQAQLPPLNQQLAQARHALALLVGKSPSEWSAPDFVFADFTPPVVIPVSLPSSLVRTRPDILAAEADLHADTARIGVATANLYPDIKLGAAFAQGAITPGTLFEYASSGWSVGPTLTTPIFNGGSLRADRRAAEAQARASLARYRQTVLTAFSQVSDVLTALAHDDERIVATTKVETVAESGLRDARTAFTLGGGPLLPVIDAQRQLDRARFNRIDSQSQRLMDIVELYAATATDWREGAAPPSGR